jgi:hypothetical protein
VGTNSSGQPVINTSFPSSFLSVRYVVVRNSFVNPTGPTNASWPTSPPYDVNLKSIFGPASGGGWTCSNVTAESDAVSYGFTLLPAAACGSLTAGD